MPEYRHYRLDGAGNISSAEWLEASDDDDAVRKAKAKSLPGASEVWSKNRLVARIDPASD
ncbi:MAG TPA: hypothetical protein VFP53_02135 [Sphingomicrobium sp.]|nr:hypothetical protein [Sphingomicrobium sp.]